MTKTVTKGCGTCPNGHNDGVAFINNTIPGWRCKDCNTGALKPKLPVRCPNCGKDNIEKRVLRSPDICICATCNVSYALEFGIFDVPSDAELADLWA